jgi:DNA-binding response OmpR family regulator
MRVLIVEDEPAIAEVLEMYLSMPSAGMTSQTVRNGHDIIPAIKASRAQGKPFDAVILDLGLADGMDGLEVLRRIRRDGDRITVIVATARVALVERLQGLDDGADDYISKPYQPEEVVARLKAINRRLSPASASLQRYGNLEFNESDSIFSINGSPLKLSRVQHTILVCLFNRRGRATRHEAVMEVIENDSDYDNSKAALTNQISRVRKLLAGAGCTLEIKTLHGIGYQLTDGDET